MSSSSNEDIAIKAEGRSAPPPYEEVATPPNGQADGVNGLGKQDSGVRIDDFGASLERSPEELAVVRKLDMYCLPIIWLMYFFNFLDRSAMVNGKLDGLADDLDLKGTQYNTCISILFVGYLVGQVPSNMVLSRVRPSFYLAGFNAMWSLVTLLTYKAYDYKTMIVCRFLLGLFEAPFFPGVTYLLGTLYTRKEIATRLSIFFTGNLVASAISGPFAAGVFQLDGRAGLAGWRWLFIIQGALSLAVAIPAFYMLPNKPLTTPWLTPEQRQLAHDRIERDTTNRTGGGKTTVLDGLSQAVRDWKTWAFCLLSNLNVTTLGFLNFLPTLVRTLGFNTSAALALTSPPYVVAMIVSVWLAHHSGRTNERTWHITACEVVAILGFVMCAATLNTGVRYAGIMLFVGSLAGVTNIVIGWTSSSLGQTDEKRAVAMAMANTCANLASVYTPYLWPDVDSPRFIKATAASAVFCAAVVAMVWFLRWMLRRKNDQMRKADPLAENFFVY
ncbi:MFS transporter [Pyricularia oryzae 70-15]|uniref:MFS transporter n=1 Tax=Pyricularia oryzae (strain 70-15 / ATCC MYA-4617 / FGSC 8958) TaxID=242507 RepID=G4MS74_PYRO7|nr:MFS transporter [Pyricularia oryzae 70-15]EHA58332.1 MFS transporter [Pyricularia oryzae 70-15]KAI7927929.1 MFS transporter [Pyricularia oryzae]KAI7928544.1 MFS transporter [Pyricularia oryzae]